MEEGSTCWQAVLATACWKAWDPEICSDRYDRKMKKSWDEIRLRVSSPFTAVLLQASAWTMPDVFQADGAAARRNAKWWEWWCLCTVSSQPHEHWQCDCHGQSICLVGLWWSLLPSGVSLVTRMLTTSCHLKTPWSEMSDQANTYILSFKDPVE